MVRNRLYFFYYIKFDLFMVLCSKLLTLSYTSPYGGS